jgi:hypothetical protein
VVVYFTQAQAIIPPVQLILEIRAVWLLEL